MNTESLTQKLSLLTPSELNEVENFIDYTLHKKRIEAQLKSDDLLNILMSQGIYSWKELASKVMNSGIVRGSGGGYMQRKHMNDWICEHFNLDQIVAEELIKTLVEKHMIGQSSYGNIG
ncbi:hypothetical protein [Mangrovimonas sp. DI 80]|uniref:hypothetical protein n=1 Tax=Mangrovimonas sp. DI 80 TaxID=1779330 RepID=UPI000976CB01|nr:hypothetical protein [Mangrovimonas sp. DI 80]OMP29700.1 hypothetical protein BKM32_16250 [Mangrovimonas sp. DI 80]